MNAQIVCRLKGGARLTFAVPEGEAVLGREPGLAVAVPAEGVSRQHAKITWDGASYWIEDLKSTNGTFVNGFDVAREGRERLRHLDVIALGRAIELLFLMREASTGVVKRLGVVSASLVSDESDTAPYDIAVGELTLGRSAANNVVVDSSAVSKLHAKIQRTTEHLVLQDLSSSNGTFVNGARVMTALLQDGDRIALAGVATYRVKIQLGEVQSLPEARAAVAAAAEEPEFSADWKTRYEWDSGEYADLMALRRRIEENESGEQRTSPLKTVEPRRSGGARVPDVTPIPKPSPRPAPPVGDPRGATPVPKPGPPVPAPRPAGAAPPPARPAPPVAAPSAKPPAAAPPPSVVPPVAAKTPAVAPAPVPAALKAPRRITRVRLSGPEGDLVVAEPGTYEIGRLSEVPLRVVHPTVSRRQAKLILSADRASLHIEHIGSSPTLVNGKLLNDTAALADGDRLQLGEVILTVRIETGA
jgi:pSer/pThr/pTyr-binding forkhead associated (FHA) protein